MNKVGDSGAGEHSDAETGKEHTQSREMDVDNFLVEVGQFGKYQIFLEALFCIMMLPGTYQTLVMTFVGHNPAWRCRKSSPECNKTGLFKIGDDYYSARCSFVNRSSWEYVEDRKYSIVTEWDLICDKKELTFIANSGLFIGWAFGAIILGIISDKYGRKCVLFPSLTVIIVVGFVSGYLPEFWSFFVARIVIGVFQGGVGLTIFVMATELVGPKYRALAGNVIWLFFCLALVFTALKAWLVPKWRILEQIVSAPYLPVLLMWKLIPESIRWLRVNNKLEEGEGLLRRIAQRNRKPWPGAKLAPVKVTGNTASFLDVFRPRKMLVSTLIQCFAWFVNGMVYYGVSLASSDLGGDIYRDFILTSLVEFPGYVLVVYGCNKLGRKHTTIWTMVVGAVACIVVSVIPSGTSHDYYNWSRVALGMLGKLCITMSFAAVYVWSVELYPTIVRSQGMALMSVVSRCGAAAAPWVAQWLKHVHIVLPFAIMGGLTMLGAILCFWLEETNGKATAETLESPEEGQEEMENKDDKLAFDNKGLSSDEPEKTSRRGEDLNVDIKPSSEGVEVTQF